MRLTALLALVPLVSTACSPAAEPPPAKGRWSEAEALVKARDYAGAYSVLEAQRVPGKVDPDLVLRLAMVRELQDEPVKAILVLREGLAADPAARSLVAPLVKMYLKVGEVDAALAALDGARLQGGPKDAELELLYGQTLARKNRLEDAVAAFDGALSAGAKPQVVKYNRALVLGELKRHAAAVADLEQALAVEPGWSAARREIARERLLASPQDRKVVEASLDELVALRGELNEDWRVAEGIGDAWLLLGDFDAAIAAYTEALQFGKNPKSVEERYKVAVLKKRERDAGGEPR
jgi:tetratricopeptide (TPR) repeat protein